MTIYDAAPAIFALVISVVGYAYAKISHDRMMARRAARKAAQQTPAE